MKNNKLSLKQIIENCTNNENPNWEKAWSEFLDRYKFLIYYFIRRSCKSWNYHRLDIQMKDISNDIFSEVIIIIYKNLNSFKNRNSEQKFIAWIQIVCSRATTSFIKRKLKNIFNEDELSELNDFKNSHSGRKLWELYENIVTLLRSHLKGNKNVERDINLFLLKVWAGFSSKQIMANPLHHELNENNINVIINRVKKTLNKTEM